MKRMFYVLTSLFLLTFLVACEGNLNPETTTDVLLSVEINPNIEMIIGSDEKVKSYRLTNEDGEIVAAGLDLVGMNYEDALRAFIGAAVDTGYIDVDRADQAVALMATHGDEEVMGEFQETVQTKLQTYFQENALGVVVLDHGTLDEELIAFSDEHDVSIGFAKMALSYLDFNPEVTIEDLLLMTPKDIMAELITNHQGAMNTYHSQKETDALAIKNELKSMVQMQVQEHKDAVTAGTKTQPDLTGIKEQYEGDYEGMKATYRARNEERTNQAKAKLNGEVPRMLSVDINPAIELVVDVQGYVYSVMYKNEDAEIVGAGLTLVGKTYQEALQLYMNAAIETGYINVTRNDNGVAVMAGSLDEDLDEQFRAQVQTTLETYFHDEVLGVVIINKGEVNEELIAFAETHEISYGFAKLVLSYLEANPEAVVDDVLLMSPTDLIEAIAAYQVNQYQQYQNERESEALLIKNEMKAMVQTQVQAHRDAVTAGTAVEPDMTGVLAQYLNNYALKVQEFVQANEARKSEAKDKVQQGQGSLLTLEINPKVEFILDPEGYVLSYMYKNEDAEIVGAGLELIGLHYEYALQYYLNAAVDTGYIDLTRSDNAVVVQTSSMNEGESSNLQVQVQTKLQTYFQENAIGAVVLNHGEIDEEVQNLIDLYDISAGYAKLILSYMEAYPESIIDDVLMLPIQELIIHLVDTQFSYMETYQNERELNCQAIKDELAEALMSQVQAHHQAVLDGTITQPDLTGVKEAYLLNYQAMHDAFVSRNEDRVNQAKGNISQGGQGN